jgi:hypothetical protein
MSLEYGKVYNFTTLAPSILGGDYKVIKVKGIISAEEATKKRDVHTLHEMLKPVITALPEKVYDCKYYLLENSDKEQFVLANEYIDMFSVTEVSSINIRIELLDANSDDTAILRNRLLELGYSNIKITTF